MADTVSWKDYYFFFHFYNLINAVKKPRPLFFSILFKRFKLFTIGYCCSNRLFIIPCDDIYRYDRDGSSSAVLGFSSYHLLIAYHPLSSSSLFISRVFYSSAGGLANAYPKKILKITWKYLKIFKNTQKAVIKINQIFISNIHIFIQNTIPPQYELVSTIYEMYKDNDGFLYVTYSGENTFG